MTPISERGSTPTTALPSCSPTDDAVFRFCLTQLSRSLEIVYRLADRLCCASPEASQRMRVLADQIAADMRASLKQWPE